MTEKNEKTTRHAETWAWWVTSAPELDDLAPIQLLLADQFTAKDGSKPDYTEAQKRHLKQHWSLRLKVVMMQLGFSRVAEEEYAAPSASEQQAEPVDGCTEENCRRCRTPEALRTPDMYHAGLSAAAEIADEVCANSRNHLFRSGAKVVAGAIRSAAPAPIASPAAITHEDVVISQRVEQALSWIAAGHTPDRNHDLDESMRKATIRDAMGHAKYVLKDYRRLHAKLADLKSDASHAARSSAAPAAPTLFRWKTSWGDWTYRTERPAGWKDLPRFEAYSLSEEKGDE